MKENNRMAEYCGIVQRMVRVRRDLYSLTFRVDQERDAGDHGDDVVEPDHAIYTAEIELSGEGIKVVPEEKLGECMRLIDEYPDQAILGKELGRKRIVGLVADKIFGRMRDDRTLQVRNWIEVASAGGREGADGETGLEG